LTPEHVILTDTHCHLDLNKFDSDRETVIERAIQAGVERILIPGLNVTSSRAAVKLAGSHPMLYAAVGIHPSEAGTWNASTRNELRDFVVGSFGSFGASGSSKIVSIGEIGLDYYWDSAPHDLQEKVLKEQLDLAAELQLPVIIHFREKSDAPDGDCASDLMKILEEWVNRLRGGKGPLAERPGVLHSFSGSAETARRAIGLNFFIGVTGPVTFENARRRQEIVAALPLERLLIETDAPFLAPHPYRGKRNEPAYVRLIADKIASLHSCDITKVATVTSENALRLFAWKESD
jgi:TatD DNase family protein